MTVYVVCLLLLLAMTDHSSASYCVCKDGLSTPVLQKNIDYACGAGADCSPISQNGPCYNPNTVKDHCNYAVNSYYQKKGQAVGSCDFSGTATVTPSIANPSSGCVYPASPSNTGTPTTTTPSTGTPMTPSTTTPSTGTGTPSITTPTTTIPGTTTPSIFGLGPTGSGINTDNNSGSVDLHHNTNLFCSFTTLALLFLGLIFLRV